MRNTEKDMRHEARGAVASGAYVSPDNASLALAPMGEPLVIGQRGLAELLADLAVATDDLSS